jgi:hypothetical protein
MAYLSYLEYREMGGTLEETTFNSYAVDADTIIDWYTFNRLWGEETIPDRVKQCEFQLIKFVQTKANLITPDTSETGGVNAGAQVMAQSNDGVSVEYSVLHADEIYHNCKDEIEDLVKRYLQGVMNSLGRKLLYRGLYPNE